jgi:hypothetical protein
MSFQKRRAPRFNPQREPVVSAFGVKARAEERGGCSRASSGTAFRKRYSTKPTITDTCFHLIIRDPRFIALASVDISPASEVDAEREEAELNALVAAARAQNVSGGEEGSELLKYEERYGFSSEELPAKLAAGEIEETAEVADWLFFLNAESSYAAG